MKKDCYSMHKNCSSTQQISLAQSTGAVEYTECISPERWDFPNERPGYDTKQFDGKAEVMLEHWGYAEYSLPSLPGPLWLGVVTLYRVLSLRQIGLQWIFKRNWIF